jgi:hypothetical protein
MTRLKLDTECNGFYIEIDKNSDQELFDNVKALLPLVKRNYTVAFDASRSTAPDIFQNQWVNRTIELIVSSGIKRFIQIMNKAVKEKHKIFRPEVGVVIVNTIEDAQKIIYSNKKYC